MARNKRGKKARFIKELEEYPLVEMVCRKVGTSRATFYRWCQEDFVFKTEAQTAQEKGRDKLNDFTESKLIENVKNNMHAAIVYWLGNNSKRYRMRTYRQYLNENQQQKYEIEHLELLLRELINIVGIDQMLKLAKLDPEAYKERIQDYLDNVNIRLSNTDKL